jgi:ribulose 1,5-bisphosphate carboxylase large subunit-like protein
VEEEFEEEEKRYYQCMNKHKMENKGRLLMYYKNVTQKVENLGMRVRFNDEESARKYISVK